MNILYITHFLNGFLMIAMPVALGFYFTRRFRLGWKLWFIGGATFILSQVGHIPFNYVFFGYLQRTLFLPEIETVLYAVLAGLSAGVFEEGARYLVLRFWAKDARSYRKGLLFGAGHGGAEAIILGVLVLATYAGMIVMQGTDLTTVLPADQLELGQQQIAAYWSTPWYLSLFGALERLFTIPVHIGLAVLVMRAFTHKQWWWVGLAVLWHAVLDTTAVLVQQTLGNYYVTEAAIGILSLITIGFIFALREPEPPAEPESPPLPPTPAADIVQPVEETDENIESTKFG